jgi:hypothetical protein
MSDYLIKVSTTINHPLATVYRNIYGDIFHQHQRICIGLRPVVLIGIYSWLEFTRRSAV